MIIEHKRIQAFTDGKENFGHITLDKLAIPETVKVYLENKKIIPSSFDKCGHPNFSVEQEMLYMFKEDELSRTNGEFTPLKVKICYEEKTFDVTRDSFDTVKGIKQSLSSLSDLHEMLDNRSLFKIAYPNEKLNEFIIFGCFYLDQFGQIMSLEKTYKDKAIFDNDVEYYELFRLRNAPYTITSNGFVLPKPNSICPCCGELITITDIKNNPCVYEDGKTYHYSCYKKYRRLTEVNKLTRCLMDAIYNKYSDYTFELLPNGYCNQECCAHIPWILFHTIDGDIIVGWRKRVISIEWQENYKSFDFSETFKDEDVTKWENGKKRGIHAWGKDKAYEYLKTVHKLIHPKN